MRYMAAGVLCATCAVSVITMLAYYQEKVALIPAFMAMASLVGAQVLLDTAKKLRLMAQKKYFLVEMELNDEIYPAAARMVDEEWVHDQLFQLGVMNSIEVEETTERMAHNNYHKRSKKV